MIHDCIAARSNRKRAVFLSAVLYFLIGVVLCTASCSNDSFRAEQAELLPLLLFDTSNADFIDFMALHAQIVSGYTDIRDIELYDEELDLRWSVTVGSDDELFERMPMGEDEELPLFYNEQTGLHENLIYPWFALPWPDYQGELQVQLVDASFESSELPVNFKPLAESQQESLRAEVRNFTPQNIALPGSWQLLGLPVGESTGVREAYSPDDLREGQLPEAVRNLETSQNLNRSDFLWYIWGVPYQYDTLVLAGPYDLSEGQ